MRESKLKKKQMLIKLQNKKLPMKTKKAKKLKRN